MKKVEKDRQGQGQSKKTPSPSEAKSLSDKDLDKVSGGVRTGDDDDVDDLEIQRVRRLQVRR